MPLPRCRLSAVGRSDPSTGDREVSLEVRAGVTTTHGRTGKLRIGCRTFLLVGGEHAPCLFDPDAGYLDFEALTTPVFLATGEQPAGNEPQEASPSATS